MTEDEAGNRSDPKKLRISIDWEPPVLNTAPYMEITLTGNKETGKLRLLFSEPIVQVAYPADSLSVYPKRIVNIEPISARDFILKDEVLEATFNSDDLVEIGSWLEQGYTPVFKIASGTLIDKAGNKNPPIYDLPFRIIAPSIIESLSDSLIFFSPNDDGVTDTMALDVTFNTTDDKYVNLNIYNPESSGTVFSLYRHKISSDGLWVDSDSIIQIKTYNSKQALHLLWNGKNQKTNKKVSEGRYLVKISATNNSQYSVQIPKVCRVIADTTHPLINSISPAFGNDVLKINSGTVLKVFPSEPIFIKDIAGGDDIQYLEGELVIACKDSNEQIFEKSFDMVAVDTLNYLYFRIDSTIINDYSGKKSEISLIVRDKANQSDTVKATVRFKNKMGKTLEYFVNYPNPFNPEQESTTFQFNKGNRNKFTLRVFDVSGKLAALKKINTFGSSGNYVNIPWTGKGIDGKPLPDGVYYALITGGSSKTKVVKILIYRN